MSDGIYTALSGAIVQQRSLDVASNNIANANTTGFRADRLRFEEALSKATGNPVAGPALRYATVGGLQSDTSSGSLRETGNPLDVGIEGEGWFVVQSEQGVRYTRNGSFVRDGDGTLTTRDGLPVLGTTALGNEAPRPILIPPNTKVIRVLEDGSLEADGAPIARLSLVRFQQDAQLTKEGENLFVANQIPVPVDLDELLMQQGFIETSNINPIAGLTELITVNRSFDALQKTIDTFRQIDSRAVRDIASTNR